MMVALWMVLRERKPEMHHSNRSAQYASCEYTGLLKENNIAISMSRRENPYAKAESFMKTLKCEQIHLNEYDNLANTRQQIGYSLKAVYNQKRLHSSFGYLPPIEFESAFHQVRDKNQAITPQQDVLCEGCSPS